MIGDRPGSFKFGSFKPGVQAAAAYSATLRCVAM